MTYFIVLLSLGQDQSMNQLVRGKKQKQKQKPEDDLQTKIILLLLGFFSCKSWSNIQVLICVCLILSEMLWGT